MTYLLTCTCCEQVQYFGLAEMLAFVQQRGMLKRQREPDRELIGELFRATIAQAVCQRCGARGGRLSDADEGDWPEGRACQECGKPIRPDRLEAIPNAVLCAECQQATETAGGPKDVEYCPRCGDIMKIRGRRGDGIARYVLSCSGCGFTEA